jgi:class 3 adenylate cyclase
MNINRTVGSRIRERRLSRRLTQNDLANALQISPQAISKWERGENAPDIGLLVPLARLLGVSCDWLLGFDLETDGLLEATVFVSGVPGYTSRAHTLSDAELRSWAKGIHVQVTESALSFGGIPVKYLGDGFLGFFTGAEHPLRAVKAALRAKKVVSEDLSVGLHSGDIYYGAWGHPDYATRDIIGDGVNIAFRAAGWTGNTESRIVATEAVMRDLAGRFRCVEHTVELKGIPEPMKLFEIRAE